MSLRRFNGIPHPHMYAALVPAEPDQGLPGFDLLMPQKVFTVGRAEHNDICIRGAGISEEHCKLVWNTEKKMMFVEWLPTTNGTWITNERYECHRLKEGESYPSFGGRISFGPSVRRYGKRTGPNDYLYSFYVYSEHEMRDYMLPDQLAERKKARARFKTAQPDTSINKYVITYRSSSDRAPNASLPRQVTPPFIPPPRLGKGFHSTGNVGHYQARESPEGHDRADPDIVWRGFVPIKPGTEPIVPGEVDLWSHHYGLPVGLHPKYTQYSGVPYDDTFTELDRERLQRREREINYIGSAEQRVERKAACEAEGRRYISPTPSPTPEPESTSGHSPSPDDSQPTMATPATAPLPTAPAPAAPPPLTTLPANASALVGIRKRKRDDDPVLDEVDKLPTKRRTVRVAASGLRTRTRSARKELLGSGSVANRGRGSKATQPGVARSTSPRRSTRLKGKPAVCYKV